MSEGLYVEGPCAIGMRRLSIIDLKTGHQPISNEDGTIWVVFNGEIYNFQSLRDRLIAQGHRFRTESDTEVLVHLYEQEGPEGLSQLRGMFAFAIWDSRQRRLFIARDRFGKKPLYYAQTDDGLYFGSELKCLRLPGIPLDVDRDALKLYFQFNYIPDPWTAFTAIRRLPAGSWLTFDADGTLTTRRYWKAPFPTPADRDAVDGDFAARLQTKFDESVRIRMIADVPLGAFLSGGLDSSSVVASMAMQSPTPVKTFSIGFEESEFNELSYARMVAERYKTEHHEITVRPDAVSLVERLVRHFDEPFGDSSAIPTYVVSEFAANFVKVVLTGDGGDELFGGYRSFLELQSRQKFDEVPVAIRKVASHVADGLPYSMYGKNYLRMASRPSAIERYFESNYAPYFLREQLLLPEWRLPSDEQFFEETFGDCLGEPSQDPLLRAMYFEATSNLTGDMLVKVDRMSMANSLEVRCPLLDHELAELAATIPASLKIRDGRGKAIMTSALGDRLPPALLDRKKMGFGVPLAAWFRGDLREMLWDHLDSARFRDRGITSADFVRHMLREHDTGRRDNSHWLWALLMLELWFREFEAEQDQVALPEPVGDAHES